ncbi:Sds3-like-domain-containing protein [Lipomyces japonicus]|uniref:Sds3-like-domain-containing protein n=1 Tax=Lipomyces japonicus TaxID=56871 RepID=UPI0034CE21BE
MTSEDNREEDVAFTEENPEEAETEIEGDIDDGRNREDSVSPKKLNERDQISNKNNTTDLLQRHQEQEQEQHQHQQQQQQQNRQGSPETFNEKPERQYIPTKQSGNDQIDKKVTTTIEQSSDADTRVTAPPAPLPAELESNESQTKPDQHDREKLNAIKKESRKIEQAKSNHAGAVVTSTSPPDLNTGDRNADVDNDGAEEGEDADEEEPEEEEEEEEETGAGNEEAGTRRKRKREADDEDTEERIQKRKEAVTSLTEIEVEFAKLRDRLHDDKISRLHAEIQMCMDSTHPELASVYDQIGLNRHQKIRLAERHRHYRRICIQNQTKSYRDQIHQQFFKDRAELRTGLISDTTESWYKITRERVALDEVAPFFGFRIPDKRSTIVRQRQAQYQEVAILTGIAKYIGFPAAPDVSTATSEEIAEDMDAIRGLSARESSMYV